MTQYNPNFNRDARGQYNPTSGFLSIKGGTNAYLLEDELNELQWIQNEARANLIRQISKSGCININDFNNPTAPGGLKELGHSNLNSFLLNGFNSLLNGYITHINAFDDNGNVITLPEPPISGSRYDFVYLQFWIKEINPEFGEKIPKYGGINNNTIDYSIIDPRQNIETTRRIQLQWKIVIVPDVNYNNYALGFVDQYNNSNINIKANNSNYNFVSNNYDNFLFVAGTGSQSDKTLFNNIDGYVYAVPLFMINRLNSSGYDKDNNPNGSVNYVDDTTTTTRPDGKFSNIIYSDQVIDLRHLSALGQEQYDKVYTTITDFNDGLNQIMSKQQLDLNVINDSIAANNIALETEITNTNITLTNSVNTLNTKIDSLNSKESQDIDNINSSLNNFNANLTSNVATLNSQILNLDNQLDTVNQTLSTNISNLRDTLNQSITTQVSQLQNQITNLQVGLNSNVSIINNEISDIQSLQSQNNNLLNNLLLNVNNLQTQLTNVSSQLVSLGIINIVTTLSSYNIDMDLSQMILNGGALQPDGTVLSDGANFPVSFTNANDYVAAITVTGTPDGQVGDYWIEKADTAFLIKNTGSPGIQINVFAFGTTDGAVIKGEGIFNGNDVGVNITQSINNGDFIYITPLADLHGENGDIYINMNSDNSGFVVYNTGSSGNNFEWFVIDTSKLMNADLVTLDLNGLSGTSSAGTYGNSYYVLSGVPIMPNPVGGVGNVGVISTFNTFTLCCTGSAVGKVQCLIFKEISTIAPNAQSAIPANNSTSVAVNASVSLIFDQEVKLTGADLSTITINDSGGNPVNNVVATLASDRQTVNITHSNFASATIYTVNVPAGVVQNGNSLTNPAISWSFTTA